MTDRPINLPPSKFTRGEIERRRKASADELNRRDRADFDARYQEMCDRDYWALGQCCAGCDHWISDAALIGKCKAAGIIPGDDVMRSAGILFSSLPVSPGFPHTKGHQHCGLFSDEFDWSSLDAEYLNRIGAMEGGTLRAKPKHARTVIHGSGL